MEFPPLLLFLVTRPAKPTQRALGAVAVQGSRPPSEAVLCVARSPEGQAAAAERPAAAAPLTN